MSDMMRKQKGFSLIEVVIGLLLLGIGLLAIAGMQATSVRGNFSSNNVTQATYIAQARLERLKTVDLGEVQQGDYTLDPIRPTDTSEMEFSPRYRVDVDAVTQLRTITCTVSWNDGVAHSISFSTIRSQ